MTSRVETINQIMTDIGYLKLTMEYPYHLGLLWDNLAIEEDSSLGVPDNLEDFFEMHEGKWRILESCPYEKVPQIDDWTGFLTEGEMVGSLMIYFRSRQGILNEESALRTVENFYGGYKGSHDLSGREIIKTLKKKGYPALEVAFKEALISSCFLQESAISDGFMKSVEYSLLNRVDSF